MATNGDRAERWADRIAGRTTRDHLAARGNVWAEGDTIYSYGRHFPMAVALRDKREAVTLVLVNGDRYSSSTTGHQSIVRSVIASRGLPNVIVPFTALENAGIVRSTVEVVERTEDGYRWTARESDTAPEDHEVTYGSIRNVRSVERDGKAAYRFEAQVHVLGEAVLRAKVYSRGSKTRTAYFLSGFDTQERQTSYFFAELPHKVATLAEAYESLKPQAVIMAEAEGREVKRQGDVFAIPLPSATMRSLRKAGATFDRQARVLGTNHAATEVAVLGNATLARRTLWHRPEFRAPDHRRVALGSTWHVLVKNTVPVAVGR